MEGVASEAASLAGHLQLSNLCWIYDSNTVTIEGHTDLAMSEDVATRFKAYRWNVVRLADANDTEGFARAVEIFRATKDRPTLIIVDSIIGYGAPHKQNTAAAHSDALGAEEVKLAKRFYGWPEDAQFLVPDGVYESFRDGIGRRGRAERDGWIKTFEAYKSAHAQAAREVETLLHGKLPEQWDRELPTFPPDEKGLATREASGKVLGAIAKTVPWLIGGAGDLAPSTKKRGAALHFGLRTAQAGGNCCAGREHAKLGAVRSAGSALSRGDSSAKRESPRHGRSWRRDWLGPLCRSRRNDHWHASFRRLGARSGLDAKIRIYCRAGIAGCQRSDCHAPESLRKHPQ
jgi:transketolase